MRNSSLRVAVITANPTPYRVPFFRQVAALEDIALKVFFLTRGSATRPWSVELDGFDYEFLVEYSIPIGGKDNARYRINPGVFTRVLKAGFDVIVIAGYNHFTTQAAIIWCALAGRPWCLMSESHVKKPRGRLKTAVKGGVLKPFLSRMGAAMVTGTLAARYIRSFGVPEEAVFVVANTPDVTHLMRLSRELGPQRDAIRRELGVDGRQVILFVGRLLAKKGLSVLIEAFGRLRKDNPRAFLLVAGDGVERDNLEAQARALGTDDVRFVGFKGSDELGRIYAAADVFALASLAEPWGVVVNEAMAAGLPVVLSDQVGASADLVCEGENGYVVPAGDSDALADRLSLVLESDARRKAMGARSREIISSWTHEASAESFRRAVVAALERGRLS